MESGFAARKLLFCCLVMVEACRGAVLFSSLPRALNVSASPKPGQVLRAGEDTVTVAWSLNHGSSALATGELGRRIKALLCYAPVSQVDRPWRKTVNNLSKDKTCQFTIFISPYDAVSTSHGRVAWLVGKDVPGAAYFVRAYLYGPDGSEVAFGESSDLFEIDGFSGIHWQLKVASVCGSVIPLVSLVVLWLLWPSNGGTPSLSTIRDLVFSCIPINRLCQLLALDRTDIPTFISAKSSALTFKQQTRTTINTKTYIHHHTKSVGEWIEHSEHFKGV